MEAPEKSEETQFMQSASTRSPCFYASDVSGAFNQTLSSLARSPCARRWQKDCDVRVKSFTSSGQRVCLFSEADVNNPALGHKVL